MRNPIFAVNDVIAQVNGLKLDYPQLSDDPDLMADMLEGSTDLQSVAEKLVTAIRDCDTTAEAIAARIGMLRERQTRATRRMNFYRDLLLRLMTVAGVKKVDTVEGNVHVVNSAKSVIITDEGAIPVAFMRIKSEPDKGEIKKSLVAGNIIPGAALTNGGTTIMIR
jgi:hypothetical protein